MHANNPTNNKTVVYSRSATLLISACFLLSGLAGLIYEVVWARQLSLFLGITTYAHTAVITAYMAGLAAGSLYFGRRADRHPQPLKIYAWLEIGVGVYAAITPWLFTALQLAYVSIADVSNIGEMSGHLTRFSIALLALLAPTFLMGGTLPLLVRGFVTELPELGKVTSRLYGINTLGAVMGTLLAGYLLLPKIGVRATIFVGVAINLGIAAVVLVVLRRINAAGVTRQTGQGEVTQQPAESQEPMSPGLRYVLLLGFGAAGFAALLTQMAWIRALILVVGGSVYAFTITLASFLTGIGLGSLLYTRFLAKPGDWLTNSWLKGRMVQAALLALLISLTLLLGLPLISKLPGWFLAGYSAGLHKNFALFQLFIFAFCASVIILPTLFMGILFPLVAVIWTRRFSRAGRGVGAAYAINTAGTILGALLGGLFILPWLGVHHSIMLAAGLYFLVAVAFWQRSNAGIRNTQRHTVTGIVVCLFMMTVWLIPPWNKALLVRGVFASPDKLIERMTSRNLKQVAELNELLYYKEGLDGIVAVRAEGNNRALVINGKTDASNSVDLPTQILLGQLPLALNRQAESALVIGLGSGITAGTLATSASLESLTVLEISGEVVEASAFFETENYAVLRDPRVNLVTADARNFLMASSSRYDLIISEPSNPWITGISNLFTDEFFKLAKGRLNPGGIMTQWFHTYSMSNADLKTILKTFDDNFRYVSVWSPLFDDMVIIGSDEPHAISLAKGRDAAAPKRSRELSRGLVNSDRDLVRLYIFGGELLSRYVRGSRINSDNDPVIEFSAPKSLYSLTTRRNLEDIFEYLQGRKEPVPTTGMVYQANDYLDAYFMKLKIVTGKSGVISDVKPEWLVSQLLLEEHGTRTYGVIGSERVLNWKEGLAEFNIRANWHPNLPSDADMQGMLRQWIGVTGTQGGITELPGDIDAKWLIRGDEESSGVQLDIVWACGSQATGFTRYSLHANLPDPGPDTRSEVPESLLNRFHCYPADQ